MSRLHCLPASVPTLEGLGRCKTRVGSQGEGILPARVQSEASAPRTYSSSVRACNSVIRGRLHAHACSQSFLSHNTTPLRTQKSAQTLSHLQNGNTCLFVSRLCMHSLCIFALACLKVTSPFCCCPTDLKGGHNLRLRRDRKRCASQQKNSLHFSLGLKDGAVNHNRPSRQGWATANAVAPSGMASVAVEL